MSSYSSEPVPTESYQYERGAEETVSTVPGQTSVDSTNTSSTSQGVTSPLVPQPIAGDGPPVKTFQSKPPNFIILAILTTAFGNLLFGIPALILSVLSSRDFQKGDIDGARNKGQASKCLSVIGMVIVLVAAILVIVYFVIIIPNIIDSMSDIQLEIADAASYLNDLNNTTGIVFYDQEK